MKIKKLLVLILAVSIGGCQTVDMSKKTNEVKPSFLSKLMGKDKPKPAEENKENTENEALLVEETVISIAPEVVFVEKPIYVPQTGKPAAPPVTGKTAVVNGVSAGTLKPEDYSHAACIYDYNPNQVYEVYTQPLRITDVYLEIGENLVDMFTSDSERWLVAAGANYSGGSQIQHVYVKPKEKNLSASMTINTDRRVYHFLLRSYDDAYMPIVRFQYKFGLSNIFERGAAQNYGGGNHALGGGLSETDAAANTQTPWATINKPVVAETNEALLDPRFLSFDYILRYSIFSKPNWMPRLVYDDGKKTYVNFDTGILQLEMPAIFEERNNLVNYRVNGNTIIIDKLIRKMTITIKGKKIQVEKKGA
jgi:type IV secretion system protein VirB9